MGWQRIFSHSILYGVVIVEFVNYLGVNCMKYQLFHVIGLMWPKLKKDHTEHCSGFNSSTPTLQEQMGQMG